MQSGTFLQETLVELKRVVWPTREQVFSGTVVTIMLLIFFGAYIYGLDLFVKWLFTIIGLASSKS
jgi:preprotein translocase subunit SecE